MLGRSEQSQCLEDSLDLRDTDRTICLYAYSLRRIDIELVVIEKDDAGRSAAEVGEDMLERGASGLEVADLVRHVVAVQEAAEPQGVTHVGPMDTIGIAQAGQGTTLGQQRQHVSDAWEKAFRPIPEVVEERLRRHSETPFCHDASGKCLWCALPRLKRTHPSRGCEPALPHLFRRELLP